MEKNPGLVIDIRPGDSVAIGGAHVELLQKSGQIARVRIVAPSDMKIEKKKGAQHGACLSS